MAAWIPVSGASVEGYEVLERVVWEFMRKIGAQSGTVAVGVNGTMIYSRGLGWRDKERKELTRPEDLLRIGSLSKCVTAALLKNLIRVKLLFNETPLLSCLPYPPESLRKVPDQRLHQIKVGHLVEHKGGWDSAGPGGDVMFKAKEIERTMRLPNPVTPRDVAWFMLGKQLDFNPGERYSYSNLGFCFLGRVIEHVTRLPFEQALLKHLLHPLGITDGSVKVGRSKMAERDPREVCYPVGEDCFSVEVLEACGGMIASAPALLHFLRHYWLVGDSRPPNSKGYQYNFFGSIPGTTAMAIQRSDGIDVVVLLNSRRDATLHEDNSELEKLVNATITTISANGSLMAKARGWLG